MKYKFIFDLDNTLYSESEYLYLIIKKFAEITKKEIPRSINSQFIEERLDRRKNDVLSNLYLTVYGEIPMKWEHELLFYLYKTLQAKNQIQLYHGCEEVLKFCSILGDNIMLTNGHREVQLNKIRCLGLEKYFNDIIILDNINFQKSNIEVWNQLIKKNVSHEDIFMIGDDPVNDIAPAKLLGIKTIRLKKGFFKLEKSDADYEVKEIKEVKSVITNLLK
ncbi:MAG: HAD family hydrolase, partial [Elusimicrobiota bacterium]|nr:HAD family hydrolase [Endomicrobiia bacterium]MDW8166727.1 HAD family hydrolase [Elusimicrobiota bacterium]